MLKNYLTTAYRHLLRHPLYSAINILGFAVGLACCIVIIAYVRGELSYESFIPENDRIYRVAGIYHAETSYGLPVIMGPAGPALAAELPGIEAFTRFRRDSDSVKRGDTLFYETVVYADGSFFDTIPLPLAAGDAATAIRAPNTVVLSEAMAKKYFGSDNPMGQVMVFDGDKPMTVAGVLKDLPENTHLKIDFLSNYRSASYTAQSATGGTALDDLEDDWGSSNHFTYLRLKPGVSAAEIQAQLPAFEARHMPDVDLSTGRIKGGDFVDLRLQRFADIHLRSADLDAGGEMKPPGDIALVYGFAGIASLILLIASINFVVLTTARSAERAKEVGMRKVLGSSRRALMAQFLIETLIVAFIAFIIALSISELATPFLRDLLESPLAGSDPGFVVAELLVIAGVGLAAGAYPALYMSAMRPAEALKGRLKMARSRVRGALVVVQFTISISLIIIASVMFAQTDYMRHVRQGYNADDVVVLRGFWREGAKGAIDAVRARLETEPSVQAIAAQHAAPGDPNFESRTFTRPGAGALRLDIATTAVDYNFFDLYQIKLVAGRGFARDHAADVTADPPPGGATSANAVITRSALKLLGFETPEAALGQPLDRVFTDNGADTGQFIHYTIIGVIDDFQMHDARYVQDPTIFFLKPGEFWSLSIKARPGQAAAAAAAAEAAWRAILPELPARVVHLDDQFANTFARDARKGGVFAAFAFLGLAIACVGLFGLAAFTVERRTKEIGIRKVMGASSRRIVGLLVWQFSRPVLIANLIAWPVAWYVARTWLKGFADRIDLTPAYFLAASAAVLALAWLTVSGHALRVARAPPIKALRYE